MGFMGLDRLIAKAIEAVIRQAVPQVYDFVLDKVYANPHVLNVNLVICGDSSHFRVVNLSPLAIHLHFLSLAYTGSASVTKSWTVPVLFHPSTDKDAGDQYVTNRIPFEPNPIFLYPRGMYYVPLSELPSDWDMTDPAKAEEKAPNILVNMKYTSQEGKDRKLEASRISVVTSTNRKFNNHGAERSADASDERSSVERAAKC